MGDNQIDHFANETNKKIKKIESKKIRNNSEISFTIFLNSPIVITVNQKLNRIYYNIKDHNKTKIYFGF